MWWITAQLVAPLLVLTCLVQCASPVPAQRNEILSTTKAPTKSKLKIIPEVKLPNDHQKQKTPPTVKPPPTKKITPKKTTTPTHLNEFSLDDILYRGLQSNEANAFIKANEQRGKTLETTYEHVREQDLNDIEALVRERNELRMRKQLVV